MNKFIPMNKIIPQGTSGVHKIIHRKPSKFEVIRDTWKFRENGLGEFNHDQRAVTILVKKTNYFPHTETVMSDTTMEHESNQDIVDIAHGDMFIAGLGIGMILVPILKNPRVKSVTVIEKYASVIKLVGPSIKKLDTENKLKIMKGDIFKIKFMNQKFNIIYFDIWNSISSDNYNVILELKKSFKKFLVKDDKERYIGAWMERQVRQLKRRDE